jgi:hypothetical protein
MNDLSTIASLVRKPTRRITMEVRRLKSARLWLAIAAIVAFGVIAASAAASVVGISGATAWGPCNWYTSNNLRYTSVANKQVRVLLSSTGKLGVQMRTKNENTGLTSQIAYYPPLNTWQNLGRYSAASTPFRLQFTCVNPRGNDSPSTDFAGSLDY